MKKIFYTTLLIQALLFLSFAQTNIPPGDVYGSWGISGSPYNVQGDITIPNDSTLIIEPGVLVNFLGYFALNVQGRLLAAGNETSKITFTINDTTGFYNPDTTLGGWDGIQFIDTPDGNDTSKIRYCILQYGKAVGSSPPDNSGGAIFISNFNKVLISNCLIAHNSAGGTDSPTGGGLSLRFTNIKLLNNEISYNHAVDGGGIQIWESSVVFANNIIKHNYAIEGGGGIWVGGNSSIEFSNDNIIENIAGNNGGGMVCWQTTEMTLVSVILSNNIANWGGGVAIFSGQIQMDSCLISSNGSNNSGGGIASDLSTVYLKNTTLDGDTATVFGGAIEIYNSSLYVHDCNLINNGAGIRGGGIHSDFSSIYILNTIFERDTAYIFGGAIGIFNSELTINSSSLTENGAGTLGGAIHSDFSTINLSNTTFERDTAGNTGGGLFLWHSNLQADDCEFNNDSAEFSGGAIAADSSSLVINNSAFSENSASINGGAIISNRGLLSINNCSFLQNTAVWGGAIISDNSEINLKNITFENNTAEHGGALSIGWCNAELNQISFAQNSAIWGGGISSTNCNLQIDSCLFYQNVAEYQGGGLEYLADTAGFVSVSQLDITNSKFEENISLTRCGAAFIEQYNSIQPLAQLSIDNCEFINNNALRVGALRIGNISDFTLSNSKFIGNNVTLYTASCTFASLSSGDVFNCLFADNVANGGTSGGAGISNSSKVDFMNCTFANNRSGSGGGIHVRTGSTVTLTNSILWGNYPDQVSLLATNDTLACTLYSNYNDIQFGVDSVHINDSISVVNWGIGNIESDPLFADTLNNDFHLQNSSPCIATGIDSTEIAGFWHHSPPFDIEGNSRPNPVGTLPDMGAYESSFPTSIAEDDLKLPDDYALYQNYPNPFNPTTRIKWQLPTGGLVTITLYNLLGKKLSVIVNEIKAAGEYEIIFDGNELTSGVYFYQLRAGDYIETKKMLFIR